MLLFQFILLFIRIPAWILYLGWSIWPQVFVFEPMDAPRDALISPWSLERQLESGSISVEARIAFADRLLDGMYESESARWNERRNALLVACIDPYSEAVNEVTAGDLYAVLGRKHGELLDVLGTDVLRAIVEPDLVDAAEFKSVTPRNVNERLQHPYVMVRFLTDVAFDIENHGALKRDRYDRRPLICNRNKLMPATHHLGSRLGIEQRHLRYGLGLDIAIDAGFANDVAIVYFPDNARRAGRAEFVDCSSGLTLALGLSCELANIDVVQRLLQWAGSDDPSERAFAFWVGAYWGRNPRTTTGPSDEAAKQLLEHAVESLHLMNVLWVNEDEPYIVREAAQLAIARLDHSGQVSLPLIREWVLGGEDPPHAQYFMPWADKQLIHGWSEHLSDLALSDHVEVRRWLAMAIPTRAGTPYDARIDEVIAVLLNDEDEEVRDSAQDAFDDRLVTVEPDLWLFWD